jgi:hypothetical protein
VRDLPLLLELVLPPPHHLLLLLLLGLLVDPRVGGLWLLAAASKRACGLRSCLSARYQAPQDRYLHLHLTAKCSSSSSSSSSSRRCSRQQQLGPAAVS